MKYFKLIQLVALVCLNSCSTYLYTLVVKKKRVSIRLGLDGATNTSTGWATRVLCLTCQQIHASALFPSG